MSSDDPSVQEELLIMRLLSGFDENEPGQPKYLDPDSPDERAARAALAKQVREGRLAGIARELLALAIDPWTASTWPGMRPLHKLKFNRATPGPSSKWARDLIVVAFIRRSLSKGGPEDAALRDAEIKFGLGKSQTHDIWLQWKKRSGLSGQ